MPQPRNHQDLLFALSSVPPPFLRNPNNSASAAAQIKWARAEWDKRGLRTSNTRIARYQKLMEQADSEALDYKKHTGELTQNLLAVHSDILEFLFVSKVALSHPHLAESPIVKEIFSGHDLAEEEKEGSSGAPRNNLFQMTVACGIQLSGLYAELENRGDIRTQIDERMVHIECKRLQSFEKTEKHFTYATKQILSAKNPPGTVGIVAVDISKAVTGGFKCLMASDEKQSDEMITNSIDHFTKQCLRFWQDQCSVTSIWIRLAAMAAIGKSNIRKGKLIHRMTQVVTDNTTPVDERFTMILSSRVGESMRLLNS